MYILIFYQYSFKGFFTMSDDIDKMHNFAKFSTFTVQNSAFSQHPVYLPSSNPYPKPSPNPLEFTDCLLFT